MKLTHPTVADRIRTWLRANPGTNFTSKKLALALPAGLVAVRSTLAVLAAKGAIVQVGEVPARSVAHAPQKVWRKR